ncbi:hypothetical protein ACFUMJ_22545 [Streptomyces olivaceus]|uniref:hypothetical protein n=1 Tax=Streptomyces TaxID=1883 RepID=UPI001FB7B0FD|nr:hypothetical protein [Streptomyces sp. CB09030]UOG83067.1 hypothetical protein L6J92_29495 [Streptomyces sp. CB09030]
METALTVFAVLFLLAVVLGVYATVKAVGAAKRTVDRGITQARRTVEDHTLRARSFVQVGPAAELAQLRLSLRTSMRSTQDALHARVAEDASLKEALGLFERLSAHGFELDGELRRLESEPDRATLSERLPALRERTERITRSAEGLRWAARDRARRFADDDLDSLSAQIDVETGALRHWTETQPGAAPPPWPEAPAADAASARQSWPEPPAHEPPRQPEPSRAPYPHPYAEPGQGQGQGQAQAQGQRQEQRSERGPVRPAIDPPGPSPVYPWQKKARPESTT